MTERTAASSEDEGKAGRQKMEAFFDWDYDIAQHHQRTAKIALAVAALACLLAIAAVTAVIALAPLKSVEAIFVRVDNATGMIDILNRIDEESTVSRQDMVDKMYLARYVRAREGYFPPTVKQQYRQVMLMTTGEERQKYEKEMSKDNPMSPLVQYGPQDRLDVQIRSIAFIGKGLAQVRYAIDKELKGGQERRYGIATIKYRYDPEANVPVSALEDNALGFEVLEYKAEPEDSAS